MSLTKDEIAQCLIEAGLDLPARQKAIKAIEEAEQEKKAEKEGGAKKSKYAYTILVRSDDPAIKAALENTEAFISKTDESIDQNSIPDRIKVGAIEQNRNSKKKGKIFTYADYFRYIKSKNHKIDGAGVKNVSKEPVRILVLDKSELNFN